MFRRRRRRRRCRRESDDVTPGTRYHGAAGFDQSSSRNSRVYYLSAAHLPR